MSWFLRGLRAGIRTEGYPGENFEAKPGATPGLPVSTTFVNSQAAADLEARCPTGAIRAYEATALIDRDRCVHCMRCAHGNPDARATWRSDFEWTHEHDELAILKELDATFGRSLNIRVVDAGDCGACLNETGHINDPLYNAHRLGFFITPTPRQADVLMVTGPVTRQMHEELRTAYEAMPDPKRVIAVGVCATNGGIFGPSFMCAGGAADAIPVDLVVPGCPPPPLAILHALLTVCGRKPPARSFRPQRADAP
jgi:Ni,Fe-hydrogenase III small subunit